MNKEKSDEYTIELDKNLRDSGVQGGKIIAEHLVLGCFLIGVPFLMIGLSAVLSMVLGNGYPTNTAIIIGAVLAMVIGLLLIISGYTIYRVKQVKN